ncbi:MAG: hypothetical protein LBV33_04330 [Lachnospiraceae bacterium]|nr:hypothetical protein [Lachnospiraceae bacterium]
MKEKIKLEDIRKLRFYTMIMVALFVVSVFAGGTLLLVGGGWIKVAVTVILWGITLGVALKIERFKKRHDIQSYRAMVAFAKGERLN